MSEQKYEEDLKIKIGSKEEARWNRVLKQAEEAKGNAELEIEINEVIAKLAEERLEKFKSS